MRPLGLRPAFLNVVHNASDKQAVPCIGKPLLPAGAGVPGVKIWKPHNNRVRVGNLHACVLALALTSCKHVSELQVASNASAATAAQTETHEVKSEGAEHIVMTVEEYEKLCSPTESDGKTSAPIAPVAGTARNSTAAPPRSVPAGTAAPQLIRRIVTVTDRGPSLDDLRSLSSLQSKVNTALEVKEEKKSGPAGLLGLLGSLWPVILTGAAVLAGFVVWKLKPPWLSVIFRLLGRSS